MGKHLSKLVALAIGLLTGGFLLAAKAPADGKQYDYATVEKVGKVLFISEGNDQYEEINVKDETQDGHHHYGPLHKRVNAFEARGYEVYSTSVVSYANASFTVPGMVILLRKPK